MVWLNSSLRTEENGPERDCPGLPGFTLARSCVIIKSAKTKIILKWQGHDLIYPAYRASSES